MIKTHINHLGEDRSNGLVVCLGLPKSGDSGALNGAEVYSDLGGTSLSKIYEIDPARMVNGLDIVINTEEYGLFKEAFFSAQKYLAFVYCKFVHFPKLSLKIGDPLGVRKENFVDVFHEINQLDNLPLLLKYPLLDKLASARIGKPALILMPGPSLHEVGKQLPDLAKKCLIICLSRTVRFCLDRGVDPDFVIQLDTFQRQRRFYPKEIAFPNTYLIPIPAAPIGAFAGRFRGLFFMQSFDLNALPNRYHLRRSSLSSLLACMGLAEVLGSPDVFLAGADLSYASGPNRYYDNHHKRKKPRAPVPANNIDDRLPIMVQNLGIRMKDAKGDWVRTDLAYFATAAEAEYFADQIHHSTGTVFYNLSGCGILPPKVFRPDGWDRLEAMDDIDRQAVYRSADGALAIKEDVRIEYLESRYEDIKGQLKGSSLFFANCLQNRNLPEAERHPIYKTTAFFNEYVGGFSEEERVELAANLCGRWHESAVRAVRFIKALKALKTRTPVPFVCYPEERDEIVAEFERRGKKTEWKFMGLAIDAKEETTDDAAFRRVFVNHLPAVMRENDCVFVSARVRSEFDYFFDTFPHETVVPLDMKGIVDLLEAHADGPAPAAKAHHEDPNLRLGYHYLNRKDYARAKKYFHEIIRKDPENHAAKEALNSIP